MQQPRPDSTHYGFLGREQVWTTGGPRELREIVAGDIVLAWSAASESVVSAPVAAVHDLGDTALGAFNVGDERDGSNLDVIAGYHQRFRSTYDERFPGAGAGEWHWDFSEAVALQSGLGVPLIAYGSDRSIYTTDRGELAFLEDYRMSNSGIALTFDADGIVDRRLVPSSPGDDGNVRVYRAPTRHLMLDGAEGFLVGAGQLVAEAWSR